MANKVEITQVFQFKITLKNAPLPIWRRVQMSNNANFEELHQAIQESMGWYSSHLYQFEKGRDYAIVDSKEMMQEYGDALASNVKLATMFTALKSKMLYTYDMGDNWEHEVVLEKILPPEVGQTYPVCIKGKGKCPPEDCGGVYGYGDLLEILANPAHEEYESMCEWLDIEEGSEWDPQEFDSED